MNASRSSHDAVEVAGEGKTGNETLLSAEVQD
jgi:paired amphipathic helix protein Sin3a